MRCLAARIGIPPPVKALGSGSNLAAGHPVLSDRAAIESAARRCPATPVPDNSVRISMLELRALLTALATCGRMPRKNANSLAIKYICSPQQSAKRPSRTGVLAPTYLNS